MRKFKLSKKTMAMAQPEEKKRRSPKAILAILLAAIMILSVVGFVWTQVLNPPTSYNNIKFVPATAGWTASINGQELFFSTHPLDAELMNVSSEAASLLRAAKVVYLTSDVNDSLREQIAAATYDMTTQLGEKGVFSVLGFTENTSFNKPIITCQNASTIVPVVYFSNSTSTGISSQGACILAEANTKANMMKIRDRLLYTILEIIP